MITAINHRIKIERPTSEQLKELGISSWYSWECEPDAFDWEYTMEEMAYFFEGRVKVITHYGEVEIKAGDLATFPEGLKCQWKVLEKIRKVYKFV